MRLTTTLNRIRACSPCQSGWRKLLDHLGKDSDPDAARKKQVEIIRSILE